MRCVRVVLAALMAMVLAACSSTVTVKFEDEKNPQRVTAVSGMKSRDAANLLSQQAFYEAKVKRKADPVCKLTAVEGQVISGVKEMACWSATAGDDSMPAPQLAPTELAENLKAAGGFVRDVGSVVVPLKTIEAASDVLRGGQNAALESQRIQGSVAGAGIDAAGRPPIGVLPSEGFRVFGVD